MIKLEKIVPIMTFFGLTSYFGFALTIYTMMTKALIIYSKIKSFKF